MTRLILFYGTMLLAIVATVGIWALFPPKLKAWIVCDEEEQNIRCVLRSYRSLSPIRLDGIWIPVGYIDALGASPPKGFREKLPRLCPVWLYDDAKREVVIWSGRIEVPRGEEITVLIPAKTPGAVSGNLYFSYEYRGVAGVLIAGGMTNAPLNKMVPYKSAKGTA